MSENECRLLSLPEELIIGIVEQVDDHKSLCCLARTCSRLQSLAEYQIYQSILVRTGEEARNTIDVLKARAARLDAIHELQIRYRYEVEHGIEELNPVLPLLQKLRHLTIEAPCCNDTPWAWGDQEWESSGRIEYGKLFERAISLPTPLQSGILSQLESLTLHSHGLGDGDARFDLDRNAVIFLHPTIRSITLSCFNIKPNIGRILATLNFKLRRSTKTTGLKSLIFDECNIFPDALEVLLKLPKALESLTIGERMHHYYQPLPLGFQGYLPALRAQENCIKYLKHIGGRDESSLMSLPIYPDDLSSLSQLRILELSPMWARKHNLAEYGVPPNLEMLRLLHVHSADFDNLINTDGSLIESLGLSKPNHLQRFEIVLSPMMSRDLHEMFWEDQIRRNNVNKLALRLRKQEIQLGIYTIRFSESRCIPPYLYGEEVPEEELSYCSLNTTQFGGLTYDDSASSQGETVNAIPDIY